MPDFKAALIEKIKEVVKIVKEAISLAINIPRITDRMIEKVAKPTASTLWTATLSVALRCTALFLGIDRITYRFLENVVKPTATTLWTVIFGFSCDAKEAPAPPPTSDNWLQNVTPPSPTYVSATDSLSVYRFSFLEVQAPIIPSLIYPVTPPAPSIVATAYPSVDQWVT